MKILNLYAGIGGNREAWGDEHKVVAVEINEEIAGVYKSKYPNDEVIIGDAHQYLLDHYDEFDFIWSSPPCPTHSRMNFAIKLKRYPSMVLYQEILFLRSWFKGKWVVENVIPYYKALVEPTVTLARHHFWSNFNIEFKEFDCIDISRCTIDELSNHLGISIPKCKNARLLLRNCVHPLVSAYIYEQF